MVECLANEWIRQWPVTYIGGWPLVNQSCLKSNRCCCTVFIFHIYFEFLNARMNCGSDFKGYRIFISRRFIYVGAATNIRDWSLAYSFICAFPCTYPTWCPYFLFNPFLHFLTADDPAKIMRHPVVQRKDNEAPCSSTKDWRRKYLFQIPPNYNSFNTYTVILKGLLK